jgi:hypothetical protein
VPSGSHAISGRRSWVGARQSSCAGAQRRAPRLEAVEAPVGREQPVPAESLEQWAGQRLLPGADRADLDVQERVGAGLGHRHNPDLGKRAAVAGLLTPGVPELLRVLLAIGHIQLEPVDRGQPPPAQKSPAGIALGHRLGHPVEQVPESLTAQAFARLRDR